MIKVQYILVIVLKLLLSLLLFHYEMCHHIRGFQQTLLLFLSNPLPPSDCVAQTKAPSSLGLSFLF